MMASCDMQPADRTEAKNWRRCCHEVAERSSKILGDFAQKQAESMSSAVRDEMGIAKAFMDLYARMAADPAAIATLSMNLWLDYMRLWQSSWMKLFGMDAGAGGRARQGRLALQGRGLVEELPLRLHQAVLPHQRAPHPRGGGERRRAARGIGEEGRVLHAPVRRRALAVELPADQPAGAARDGVERRPEPGARA